MSRLKNYVIRGGALLVFLIFSVPYILYFSGSRVEGVVRDREIKMTSEIKQEEDAASSKEVYTYTEYIYIDFEVDGKQYTSVFSTVKAKDRHVKLSFDSVLLSSTIKIGDKIMVRYSKDDPSVNSSILSYDFRYTQDLAFITGSILVFVASFVDLSKVNRRKKSRKNNKSKSVEPEEIDVTYYTDKFDINELNLYYNNRFFAFVNAISDNKEGTISLESALLNGFITTGDFAIIAKGDDHFARLEFLEAKTSDGFTHQKIDNSIYKYATLIFKRSADANVVQCDSILYIKK